MNKKGKLLSIFSMIITLVIIVGICMAKISYYSGKMHSDFFNSMKQCLAGSIPSILFSLSPMIMLALSNLFIIISRTYKKAPIIITLILCCLLLAVNILFELVSAIGATMCLDDDWMKIMSKMLLYHFVSAIPILLTLIALLRTCLHKK